MHRTLPCRVYLLLTRIPVVDRELIARPGLIAQPSSVKEVGDVHPKCVSDQQQIRVLRIPLRVLVPLDRPSLHAGEVGQLLLGEVCLPP